MYPFIKVLLSTLVLLSGSAWAGAKTYIVDADLEGLERDMRIQEFPEVALIVATEISPAWEVGIEPNETGKYRTVVAESPANYVPVTELHFIHLTDVSWETMAKGNGTIKLLQAMVKMYQGDPSVITEDSTEPTVLLHFLGRTAVVKGAMQGAADLKLFVGDANVSDSAIPPPDDTSHPGYGVVMMIAITQGGKLEAAEPLIRRS